MRIGAMRSGQAAAEYVVLVGFMTLVASVLWFVVRAAARSAERAETLVSSDYP